MMKPNIMASDTIFNEKGDMSQFQTPIRGNIVRGHQQQSKESRRQMNESTIKKNGNSSQKIRSCNCRKSQCLKLYCDCLANGELCGSECQCVNCHNNHMHLEERNCKIEEIVDKNQDALIERSSGTKQLKGCNCRKSHCQKKYCDCFNAGVACSEVCKCDDCKNCDTKKLNHQQLKQVKQILSQCQIVNKQYIIISSQEALESLKLIRETNG